MFESYSFQKIIGLLSEFWQSKGCLLWHPYSEKVGAGTMNPATSLRVLGPEPFNVVYVEPSFRPDDGRFGENPNRLQMHHQLQVILKPDPTNPQELYLESLAKIGIDFKIHDVRFVEDNWESPALGAWGLGWEVWLDGMEITQFTYFQQAGGMVLNPVSIEITYGLERIAMYLQKVKSVFDIRWNDWMSYGELLKKQEIEYCHYSFHHADIGRLKTLFDLYHDEAESILSHGLVLPAHDYVLRCSHTFNLLDTRGVVGVTERAHYFAKMRDLSRRVSQAFLAQREELEFPLTRKRGGQDLPSVSSGVEPTPFDGHFDKPRGDFLLELGCEELPPDDIEIALSAIESNLTQFLTRENLTSQQVAFEGTPRRLVTRLYGVDLSQPDREVEVKGPPAKAAYQADGSLSNPGEGFVKKQGGEEFTLERKRDEKGGEYLYLRKIIPGKTLYHLLGENLPTLLKGIQFPKSMKWNDSGVSFSRPVRWVLALLENQVVPFNFAGLNSSRVTRGNRSEQSPELAVDSVSEYEKILELGGVELSLKERQEVLFTGFDAIEQAIKGQVDRDPALVKEVLQLIEAPTLFLGSFDPLYLELPSEVLVAVMKKHQRYFPIYNQEGSLLPYYIGVANGLERVTDQIKSGNDKVIRARYEDARFFYREDSLKTPQDFLNRIKTLSFEEKLGSMFDKTTRLAKGLLLLKKAVAQFKDLADLDLTRAGELSKMDLGSQLVTEMTSLQGVMGKHYAKKAGENEAVSLALLEHYSPSGSEDSLPGALLSKALALADKLDSLIGLLGRGKAPGGSADPFGLRREAIGVLRILMDGELDLDLSGFAPQWQKLFSIDLLPDTPLLFRKFLEGRLVVLLKERGIRHDVVQSVVAGDSFNPRLILLKGLILQEMVNSDSWSPIFEQYARCHRIILTEKEAPPLHPEVIQDEWTRNLLNKTQNWLEKTNHEEGFRLVGEALADLAPDIENFFNQVMVNCEETPLKETRKGILFRIVLMTQSLGDLSLLEGF